MPVAAPTTSPTPTIPASTSIRGATPGRLCRRPARIRGRGRSASPQPEGPSFIPHRRAGDPVVANSIVSRTAAPNRVCAAPIRLKLTQGAAPDRSADNCCRGVAQMICEI